MSYSYKSYDGTTVTIDSTPFSISGISGNICPSDPFLIYRDTYYGGFAPFCLDSLYTSCVCAW